jgi:peptidoglycan hydrolase-like protein with peptidoglycan-binding domain
MATYKRGAKGKTVRQIQTRLKELGYHTGPVNGQFGPATEKAVRAFQTSVKLEVDGKVGPNTWAALFPVPETSSASASPAPAAAQSSNPTARLNEQRLSRLHPVLAIRGRAMIELCAYEGIAVLVTQGLRTWEEQDALYAIGRTKPPIGKIVTKAKGGSSYHNFGLAFDIVVLDTVGKADRDTSHPGWRRAAELGKSVGLEWGGDWTSFKDYPHFQYTADLATAQCRELYAGGLEAVWEKVR